MKGEKRKKKEECHFIFFYFLLELLGKLKEHIISPDKEAFVLK